MKRLFLTSSAAILFLSTPVFAKPWHGITPLSSTRADVDRILGKPMTLVNYWATYETPTESVSILYSNGRGCLSGSNSDWDVPASRVVSMIVALQTIVRFDSLSIDESKYQKVFDPHSVNHTEYVNKDEGESISVNNGEISSFRYTADSASDHLKCDQKQRTHSSPRPVAFKLDEYGNLPRRDEQRRLDNFSIALTELPGSTGYIFSYSGGFATSARARARESRKKLSSQSP